MTLKRKDGFSLIELAVVVLIIAILAALAIPAFRHILKESRFSTLATDLRTHGDAFTTYALDSGDYPPSHETIGAYVPELNSGERALSPKWLEASPVGGRYTWIYTTEADPNERSAYIQITPTAEFPFAVSLADMADLDEKIDDGNTSTGYLQVAGGRLRYFLKIGNN